MALIRKIAGVTRLDGNLAQATLRLYDAATGEFRAETQSDVGTGEYAFEDSTGDVMDQGETFFVLADYGAGVRPLAHGPISPADEEEPGDPYWSNVAALFHMDGLEGASSFYDEKTEQYATAYGGVSLTTGVKKFGTASAVFDAVNDYISFAKAAAAGNNLFALDWTIEGWVSASADNLPLGFFTTGSPGLAGIAIRSWYNLGLTLITSPTTGGEEYPLGVSVDLNTWTHVAFTKQGTTLRAFKNGVLVGNVTYTKAVKNDYALYAIGSERSTAYSRGFKGYIDEFRLTVGLCRYTESFTPQTAPFLHE
jgi:hypothetical protein